MSGRVDQNQEATEIALRDLFKDTDGKKWKKRDGWTVDGSNFHLFYGVELSFGVISTLNLSFNSLRGKLNDSMYFMYTLERLSLDDNHLKGNLSDNVGKLSALSKLHLQFNKLSGSQI